MKKTFRYLMLLAAVAVGFVSCSDDDDLTTADALFRPVINETDNIIHGLTADNVPYMIINWDNYTDANQYVLNIAASNGSDTREVTTDTTVCRFDDLEYDCEYNVSITAKNTGTGLSSKPFTLTTTTLDYPTKLSSFSATDVIDNAARVRWNEGVGYDMLRVIKDSNDSIVAEINLTGEDRAALSKIVTGLQPRTSYRVEAYENGLYKGKKRFTTVAAESFDGVVFDLREMVDSIARNFITTDQIAADVAENAGKDITYVLKGGFDYKISGGTAIPSTTNKVKFVTGLTLAGYARFIQSGGFTMASEAQINAVVFEKIDFVSDKVNNGSNPVDGNREKGWGGRQVFNVNNTKGTMESLTYKSCSFTGYRAVTRAQNASDAIHNITFDDCQINCIGDQGVVTTTNKAADWRSVKFKNCTITNIVMLCDFRATLSTLTLSMENCTFCYAPMETTANANTPMFRLGTGNVNLLINKSLFGPAMASVDSAGDEIYPYQAGTVGSIFITGTPNSREVADSYRTDFTWIDLGTPEAPKTYELEGLVNLNMSETGLWSNPAKGQYNVIGTRSGVDLKSLGDTRWQ